MNLKPESKEPVTILMVPFDRYTEFPKSVDAVLKDTSYPFRLVVIEGGAPEAVRHELEKRKKEHKNVQILYSDRPLRMAAAFNMGLVHVRTQRAVLMHNKLHVTPGWLQSLVLESESKDGVILPHIDHANGVPFTFMHAFLAKRALLEEIGLFDESVGTPFWGVDLENRLKSKGVPIRREPAAVLEYRSSKSVLKRTDRDLFLYQWDDPHAHQTLAYLKQKWGSAPQESEYHAWLTKKRQLTRPRQAIPVQALPLFSMAKLIHLLHRA